PAGRFEVSAGTLWLGSAALGSSDATLTGSSGDRFRLFSTSSDLGGAVGLVGRVGRRVTRAVETEISGSYVSPRLTTRISNDAESAPSATVSDTIRQFTIDGGVLIALPWRVGRRVRPFVTAGGGYLRQLHEGNVLAQTGRLAYAGGGARVPLL